MAAVSANVMHHQQSNHAKMQEQSDDDSNDGSCHSIAGEKNDGSSPEYKPASPDTRVASSFLVAPADPGPAYQQHPSDQPSMLLLSGQDHRCTTSPETKSMHGSLQNSPFSMHNVLKMKQERDSVSPATCGVFSTEKLLENTPNYVRSPHVEENHRISYSPTLHRRESSSLDEDSPRKPDRVAYRSNSDYESNEEKVSNQRSRTRMEDVEENSCCSEDTVLSVGNEAQVTNFDSENRTSSTANSQILSPRSSPTPSPASIPPPNHVPNLSSFKHIQSHLSAISQLSQNLHTSQHMLLRPNPIAPNPLLFLNQNRLLFNPHHGLQPVEQIHPNHQSLSNSPTSAVPAMSRLSPSEISPNQSTHNQLSPTSPGCDGKLNLLSNFAVLGQQAGLQQNLRYYKQMPFANPVAMHMGQHLQGLSSGFSLANKNHNEDLVESNRKGIARERDKASTNGNTSINSVNERLFGTSKSNQMSAEDAFLNRNGLKFSIDNILKADFGRRITDPLHKRSKSGSVHGKHKLGAPGANPPSQPGASKHHQVPLHHHANLKDPTFAGGAAKSGAFHPQSKDSNNYFKNGPGTSPSGASLSSSATSSRLASERLSVESRLTDLKSGTSLQNNLVTSSSVSSGGSGASDKPGAPIDLSKQELAASEEKKGDGPIVWPAWVYCTRYSDRPSSGPRTRRPKKAPGEKSPGTREEEKRPRTAFSGPQLARLKHEFAENRYLTERRRQQLSAELGLNEAQIKIWFQNKRAKIKKASGQKNPLALQLMAQGLYNHSTVPLSREEEELQELHARETREANA